MKAFWLLACSLSVMSLGWAIDGESELEDPVLQARYENINQELRCLVCQNQTIADSNAGLAVDLRRQVREMLEAGKSDEEIMAFMTQRYGDFVTYRPPFTTRTYFLWFAPLIFVLIGLAVIVSIVRNRSSLPIDDNDDLEADEGEGGWT